MSLTHGFACLCDWLLHGSNDLTMPRSWLSDRQRMRSYTAYTMRQLQQGAVVSDVAAMQRKAFWANVAAKRATADNVTEFKRKAR